MIMKRLNLPHASRRRLLAVFLAMTVTIMAPLLVLSQTPGMERRQDKRDDRNERVQQRDDKAVERRDDPIGVRGPERREDRRELRTDRKTDRRERIY
jgi:hypothetical protein